MTDLITTARSNGRAQETGLPRGLVVIGLALGAWAIVALFAGLALRVLGLL
jgi:hypothetical protein